MNLIDDKGHNGGFLPKVGKFQLLVHDNQNKQHLTSSRSDASSPSVDRWINSSKFKQLLVTLK